MLRSTEFSELTGGNVYFKLENEQVTGSFKARGSLNKILSLSKEERSKQLITASTGNHALGFARAVQLTHSEGTVYLPKTASSSKVQKLRDYPIQIEFIDGDSLATEIAAKKIAREQGAIWVSPYNDYEVMAGQGTIAVELTEQIEKIDEVLVTVGGGGLIAGIGSYLKSIDPSIKISACQPANSMEMTLSLEAGKIVQQPDAQPTLSDGSAGGIEPDALTFEICQEIIDRTITVSETEIASALRLFIETHQKVIEGSAAVAIAAMIKEKKRLKGKNVVVIICGGNIDDKILEGIMSETEF